MRRGRPPHPDVLTPRQWEVLELVREGLSNGEIARELGISTDGAKFHVSEILTKLGVSTRREAAEWDGQPAETERVEQERAPTACLISLGEYRQLPAGSSAAATGRAMPHIVAGAPEWRERAA